MACYRLGIHDETVIPGHLLNSLVIATNRVELTYCPQGDVSMVSNL